MVITMKNNKILIATVLVIMSVLVVSVPMALFSHLPIIGKALELIFAVILIIVTIVIFVVAGRRNKK